MNFKKLNFALAMTGVLVYCDNTFALNFNNNTSNAAVISPPVETVVHPPIKITPSQPIDFQWDNSLDMTVINQVSKQINRQISSSVTNHITENLISESRTEKNGFKPDDVWTNFSWSTLTNEAKTLDDFNTDIYQSAVGIDKKIGDFYIGGTVVYVSTNTDFSNSVNDVKQTVNITPYAAYKINNNVFLSALSGYLYTGSTATSSTESDTQANISEVDVNTFHIVDNWFMKGKLGGRYYHSDTEMNNHQTTQNKEYNSNTLTFLTDISGGYKFDDELKVFTGILYELNNQSDVNKTKLQLNDGNAFYCNAGVDYLVSKEFSLGANLQTDLSNSTVDLTTVGLNMRLEM